MLNGNLKCIDCKNILVAAEHDLNVEESIYIRLTSRGGLSVPSTELSNFVSHAIVALDIVEKYIFYPLVDKIHWTDEFCCDKNKMLEI